MFPHSILGGMVCRVNNKYKLRLIYQKNKDKNLNEDDEVGEKVINKIKIDEAFEFYNIDKIYKEKSYRCAEEINQNDDYKKSFNDVYKILYCCDFSKIEELWQIKDVNELFVNNINPFVTNLMIILGYETHKNNMNKYGFDIKQVEIHKNRVKESLTSIRFNFLPFGM